MKSLDLKSNLAGVNRRKAQLAPEATVREVEILRNNGMRRTARKRETLCRVDARARAASIEPVRSNY